MNFLIPSTSQLLDTVVAILSAYVLAVPLAWERKSRGATNVGWRTLPLVSVGSCTYLLLARFLFESGIFDADGQARALRAMMTGIGFIGGGAILKRPKRGHGVAGVTTAASVWLAGAIGAALAHGYYTIAIALTLTDLFVLGLTARLAEETGTETEEVREGDDGS